MDDYLISSQVSQLIEKSVIDVLKEGEDKVDYYLNVIKIISSSFINLAHYETGRDFKEIKDKLLSDISIYSEEIKQTSMEMNSVMRPLLGSEFSYKKIDKLDVN